MSEIKITDMSFGEMFSYQQFTNVQFDLEDHVNPEPHEQHVYVCGGEGKLKSKILQIN